MSLGMLACLILSLLTYPLAFPLSENKLFPLLFCAHLFSSSMCGWEGDFLTLSFIFVSFHLLTCDFANKTINDGYIPPTPSQLWILVFVLLSFSVSVSVLCALCVRCDFDCHSACTTGSSTIPANNDRLERTLDYVQCEPWQWIFSPRRLTIGRQILTLECHRVQWAEMPVGNTSARCRKWHLISYVLMWLGGRTSRREKGWQATDTIVCDATLPKIGSLRAVLHTFGYNTEHAVTMHPEESYCLVLGAGHDAHVI